jgi:hypothetical protein
MALICYAFMKFPCLNLVPETRNPEMFDGIPQSLKANARKVPHIKAFITN